MSWWPRWSGGPTERRWLRPARASTHDVRWRFQTFPSPLRHDPCSNSSIPAFGCRAVWEPVLCIRCVNPQDSVTSDRPFGVLGTGGRNL